MYFSRSISVVFELTNGNLVELREKNRAWFRKKSYYIHQHNNQKVVHQLLLSCILGLCSSKKFLFCQKIANIGKLPVVYDAIHREPTFRLWMSLHKTFQLQYRLRMWSLCHHQPRLNYFCYHMKLKSTRCLKWTKWTENGPNGTNGPHGPDELNGPNGPKLQIRIIEKWTNL